MTRTPSATIGSSGFVCLYRDLFGNPQFRGKDDEYAAIWLIASAVWKPVRVRVDGKDIDLERGQCCYTISYLAEAWECVKSTAHARLRQFIKNGFIRTELRTGLTVITVCEYDKYQIDPNEPRTEDRTLPERSPNGVRTNKKEGNKGNEEKKEDPLAASAAVIWNDVVKGTLQPATMPLSVDREKQVLALLDKRLNNNLEEWRAYCERIVRSDHLTGGSPSREGYKKSFKADFHWVTNDDNYCKIVEGKHDDAEDDEWFPTGIDIDDEDRLFGDD